MTTGLRGHAEARTDDKGRIKMPATFKKSIEGGYGPSLFITALTNNYLQIYPLPVWEEIEDKVNNLGAMDPRKRKFLTRANRYGSVVEMDNQGRIPLKQAQRELAGVDDEVVLIGCTNHLELWAAQRLTQMEDTDEITPEDFAGLGI